MNGQQNSVEERITLVEAALRILNTHDPFEKAKLGETIATRWIQGSIYQPFNQFLDFDVPDRPARLFNVKLVPPRLMPKLGKAGNLRSRQAILHSLVHTESWAIDLSWDIIARFGKQESLPREFFTDFVNVARDEGRHFTILVARLEELGSFYGSFPAHDGLWDSAIATSKDLLARLAVEHCVHEARGLDVLPMTITRFRNGGDHRTADLLERVVYPEEITHCAAGVKWFKYLCLRRTRIPICVESDSSKIREEDSMEKEVEDARNMDQKTLSRPSDEDDDDDLVIQAFHAKVRNYFSGPLKPPFNEKARKEAGFGPQWYEPLAVKET